MRKLLVVATFFLVILSAWVGGHVYIARRLILDTGLSGFAAGGALLLLGFLCALVVPQWLAERFLPPRLSRMVSWPTFVWMGIAYFTVLALAASDAVLAIAGAPALAGAAAPAPNGAATTRAVVVALAALAASGVALVGALRRPRDTRVEIELERWPRELDGFRIVQISDVHIGPMRDRRFAREITERVNALEPDLIAVTGDLVDGPVAHLADEVAPFAELRAKHGVFFVTGNHDYYSGADPWLEHVRKLGMRPLRNERVEIRANGAAFDLAGVDDHRGYLFGPGHGEDVPKALAGRNPSRPVVLLAHDPSTFRSASQHDVDLQISGHTHGGQLWPFGYVVRLVVKYVAGEYQRGRSRLFVSRGTGFWGPPMRLGAPPEVVEIVLRSPQRSPLGARADA
ncbi:MAG TPA: metallophosphoesterase [Candidatus Binatia bacterium]